MEHLYQQQYGGTMQMQKVVALEDGIYPRIKLRISG